MTYKFQWNLDGEERKEETKKPLKCMSWQNNLWVVISFMLGEWHVRELMINQIPWDTKNEWITNFLSHIWYSSPSCYNGLLPSLKEVVQTWLGKLANIFCPEPEKKQLLKMVYPTKPLFMLTSKKYKACKNRKMKATLNNFKKE